MIEQAIDTFGRIDIVVNNAGILRDVIFHKMTEDDWDSVMNVHLKGSFNTSPRRVDTFPQSAIRPLHSLHVNVGSDR